MKLDKIANSKNDEFYTPVYAVEPIIKHLKPNSIIWCLFDTEESNYVKILETLGHTVVHTHKNMPPFLEGDKQMNGDFFFLADNMNLKDIDYIISNPPYSMKNEVLEKLFELKKPFAMLLGVVGIFESRLRFRLFSNNPWEIMYFDKRVSYFKDYNDAKPELNPPFSSVYITQNILPEKVMFEIINKNRVKFYPKDFQNERKKNNE